MRIILSILLFNLFAVSELAQSLSLGDLDEQVQGIIIYGNNSYLVTSTGYLLLPDYDQNEQYRDYYRKVYGDSTISNPNTILTPPDQQLFNYIVPFLDVGSLGNNYIHFPEEYYLRDFLEYDESGRFQYRKGIGSIIWEFLKKKGSE